MVEDLIKRLKDSAQAATPQNLDTAQSADHYNDGRWIECPTCGGEGGVELNADFCNYDGHALGVQFYGIGPEHLAAEAYFRAASPAAILELIAMIEQQSARLTALESERDALLAAAGKEAVAKLQVMYGPVPESNGKTNWTAILHKGDLAEGHTIDRSEYPDRVRYAADCVRYLIGELQDRPWILDYDADKHSGYVAPTAALEKGGGRDAWQPIETAQSAEQDERVEAYSRGWDDAQHYAAPQETSTKMLREMAYELQLVPNGDVVCVQFLDVLRKQYKAAFNAARAASTQSTAPQPAGWQPIETAPKDGRMFLGWVDAVRYGESDEGVQFETNVSEHDFCRWNEHHGYFENMMGQIGDAYHVTHWQPLPAPPAALSQKANDGLSLRAQYEDACIAANMNARDAERYRWLRDKGFDYVEWQKLKRIEDDAEFAAYIDAALSQKAGEQQ